MGDVMNHVIVQAPFAYVVRENDGWGDHLVVCAPTLAEAARLAAPKLPRLNGALFGKAQNVTAYFGPREERSMLGTVQRVTKFGEGRALIVPLDAYARRDDSESDDSILAWIRQRAAKIAAAKAKHPEDKHVWQEAEGMGRCSHTDPEAKQLADYRATADWLWRDDVDETWWQTYVPAESEGVKV